MRNWAPGDSQVYRVKIVRKTQRRNPNYRHPEVVQNSEGKWVRIEPTPGEEPSIWTDDETRTEYYGPYQNKGAARGIRNKETRSTWGQKSILTADIEIGSIIWEVLDE